MLLVMVKVKVIFYMWNNQDDRATDHAVTDSCYIFFCFRFTQNYGVLGVLDRLHGTDVMFRNSRVYDRHIMLLGLTPLKQSYPDNPKKGSPNKSK